MLFHPDHIVPVIEFIAALIKFPNKPVTQMLMKEYAVSGQIGILCFRISNAGVQIENMLAANTFSSASYSSLLMPCRLLSRRT